MIVADRREGGVLDVELAGRSRASAWQKLEARVPLEVKILIPLVVVTLASSAIFGYVFDTQQEAAAQANAGASALAVADSAVSAVAYLSADPADLQSALQTTAQSQPHETSIWIVDLIDPGKTVVAASNAGDVGRKSILTAAEADAARAGGTMQDFVSGGQSLLTVVAIPGHIYAAVVLTSLSAEAATARTTAVWIGLAVLAVCLLEIGAAMFVLETGVLRRVRRIRATVVDFGNAVDYGVPSDIAREKGNDELLNLAIEVDQKLAELGQHERVDDVISELGVLALSSAGPGELAQRALEITRDAAGLEKCFLVDVRGRALDVESPNGTTNGHAGPTLSIWVGALVRAAAAARRPILSDGLGSASRYWEAEAAKESAAAAFVPLPGAEAPLGVMVGVAGAGRRIAPAGISLMEAVATALGESLQRGEALKARHESDIKSEALSTVSHEMRSPINSVLGFTELLLSGSPGTLNEQQREYVNRISSASQNLLSLVDDYLDLARVMAGSLALKREPVAIAPVIDEVIKQLEPLAQQRGVVVKSTASPDPVAYGDPLRVRQVLTNLVSNAIKFTDARGYVRVEAAGGANGVRISVIDTGVGIPLDRQHLVFKEFADIRGDGSNDTGTGLALTKRFVEAMGGFIRFTSSPGAGTAFDVWLPGERSPVAPPAGTPAPPSA